MEFNVKCLTVLVATCFTVVIAIPIRMEMQDGKPVLVMRARFDDADTTLEEVRVASVPEHRISERAESSNLKPSLFGSECTEESARFGSTAGESHELLSELSDPEDRFFALMKHQRLTQALHRLDVAKQNVLIPSGIHKRRIRKHEL